MSGDQPPPPGWQPPEQEPPPHWRTPPPAAEGRPPHPGYPGYPTSPPAALAVAHRPGAIPLRPLVLSDIFDAAFRIIRYNPRATIGAAVLVSAVAMVVPIAVTLATGSTHGLTPDLGSGDVTDNQVADVLIGLGGLLAGSQLQAVGLLFVSGMIAHVSSAAAVGRQLTMGEAWAATRGKRWRLLGMSLLLGLGVLVVVGLVVALVTAVALVLDAPVGVVVLLAVLAGVGVVAAYLWYWVRVRALAVPTLMLEPVGIFGALRRAIRLTRRQFWRLLGLLLLVSLVVGVAGGILQLPFSIAGQVFLTASTDGGYGLLIYIVLTAVGTVVSSAVLQPFTAAVSALLYLDQRIRKEAYDVELLGRVGLLPL